MFLFVRLCVLRCALAGRKCNWLEWGGCQKNFFVWCRSTCAFAKEETFRTISASSSSPLASHTRTPYLSSYPLPTSSSLICTNKSRWWLQCSLSKPIVALL